MLQKARDLVDDVLNKEGNVVGNDKGVKSSRAIGITDCRVPLQFTGLEKKGSNITIQSVHFPCMAVAILTD